MWSNKRKPCKHIKTLRHSFHSEIRNNALSCNLCRITSIGLTNHPGQLSLAIPPWVGAMRTGQRAVGLCSWGVKAGMARVLCQVKLCNPCIHVSYLSAEVWLSTIQIHVYFNLLHWCGYRQQYNLLTVYCAEYRHRILCSRGLTATDLAISVERQSSESGA